MKKRKRQNDGRWHGVKKHLKNNSVWYLFFLSWLLNIVIKCLKFPSLTIRPEVFAESGTNFFVHAYYHNLWTNITATDAGYLPWIQRIVALITIKLFHAVSLYPFITQWTGIFLLTLFCSLIVLPVFRRLISSDSIRFFIAIALSMISDYELNAFINFIYFGGIFTFLMIFVDKEKMKRIFAILLGLLAGLIFCSKGVFIIFLPVYFGGIVYHYFKKQFNSVWYYGIAFFLGIIQAAVLFSHSSGVQGGEKSLFALIFYLLKAFYYLLLTYRHVLIGSFTTDKGFLISFILVLLVLALGLWKLWQRKEWFQLTFIAVGNILAFTSLFLTVFLAHNNIDILVPVQNPQERISSTVSSPQTQQITIQVDKSLFFVKHFVNLRSMFFSNMLIFLVSVVIILSLFDKRAYKLLVLAFIIYASGAFGQLSVEEPYPTSSQSVSQWQIYSPLITRDTYCIPINPDSFLLTKNCHYLGMASTSSLEKQSIDAMVVVSKKEKVPQGVDLQIFDGNGKEIAKTKRLTPTDYIYGYFLFEKPVRGVKSVVLKDSRGHTINNPEVLVFGR